jgi:hypothetical protein
MSTNVLVVLIIGTLAFWLDRDERKRFDLTQYPQLTAIAAPAGAQAAWEAIRECSTAREKKFGSIRWYAATEVPQALTLGADTGQLVGGVYIIRMHTIVIRADILALPVEHPDRRIVLQHELMHAREYAAGHSRRYFHPRCGTDWPA